MRIVPTNLVAVSAAATLLLGATSCASSPNRPAPVDTGARALVYGHIEAPHPIQRVQLAKVKSARHPYGRVLENGDFYFENVAPGEYLLMRFMAGGQWYSLMNGDRQNNMRFYVRAQPGGVHYVGSWRVTGTKNNLIRPDEFSIARVGSPSENALLQRLRPALSGTGWEKRIAGARSTTAPTSPADQRKR